MNERRKQIQDTDYGNKRMQTKNTSVIFAPPPKKIKIKDNCKKPFTRHQNEGPRFKQLTSNEQFTTATFLKLTSQETILITIN